MDIDDQITAVFDREGRVYENVPGDAGGPTKYGITIGRLASEDGVKLTSKNWSAYENRVRNLTEDQAREIYKKAYFRRPRIDQLPKAWQPYVFDFYVNSGNWAIVYLQRVIDEFGYDCDDDGKIGPGTITAAFEAEHDVPDLVFVQAYLEARRMFYERIVDSRPNQAKFLRGWMNRVAGLEKIAKEELA